MNSRRVDQDMEIKVIKGPLDAEMLGAVARLYGTYDKKYSSIDFCRTIFNENPSGYSFHSFAYVEGKAVGHCATIPMEIYVNGKTELSAKAEALFLEGEHRSKLIKEGNLEVPAVVSIAAYLYKSTLEEPSIKVIHGICDDVIGLIHRMAGCKRRTARQTKYMFISSPKFISDSGSSLRKKLALGAVFVLQQILLNFFYVVLLISLKLSSYRHIVGDSNQPIQFMTIPPDALTNENTWTLARNAANFSWFFKTGLFETVTTKDPIRQCAVIRRNLEDGHDLEIVAYNSVGGGGFEALGLLYCIIKRAKETKAGRVVFYDSALHEKKAGVQLASRLLGFVSRNEEALIFLKSNDSFFLRRDSVLFTPLLHGVF